MAGDQGAAVVPEELAVDQHPVEEEKMEVGRNEEAEIPAETETAKPVEAETEKPEPMETEAAAEEKEPEAEPSVDEKVEAAAVEGDSDQKKEDSEVEPEPAKPAEISPFDALMNEEEKVVEKKKEEKKEGEEQTDEKKDEEKKEGDQTEGKKENEVFDVEDDGKEIAPEIKTTPDEDYFAGVDSEELDWYKEHVQDHNKKIQCTSCFKQVRTKLLDGSSF